MDILYAMVLRISKYCILHIQQAAMVVMELYGVFNELSVQANMV